MSTHRAWEADWHSLTHSLWACSICGRCPEDCIEGCYHAEDR